MKNRESLYPGRVKLTPVDAANGIYDMIRADDPQEEGTPLNKKLLDFAVAACGVTDGTATAYTLDDEFGGFTLTDGAKVNFRLHVASGVGATLNVNGTGAKRIVGISGNDALLGILAGTWVTARYNSATDKYVVEGGGSRTIDVLTSNSSAIVVDVPDCRLCHIRVLAPLYASSDCFLKITADQALTWMSGSVKPAASTSYTAPTSMGSSGSTSIISTYADLRYGGSIDIDVANSDNTAVLMYKVSGGCVIGAGTGYKDGVKISSVTLTNQSTFRHGTVIEKEVI